MSPDPIALFEALIGPVGRELLARLPDGPIPAERVLPLGSELRRAFPAEVVAAALTLHELRQRGRAKFERASEMVFTRAGLEQASSERTAGHRARRFDGMRRLADLCTGIGGDLIALAAIAPTLAVDRDPLHLRMARYNAAVYDRAGNVGPLLADVRDIGLTEIDGVTIDPARRDERGRTGAYRAEPPLDWCLGLVERVPAVAIKTAPGIDRDAIPLGWEVEFVAEERALKEAVLWSPALATTTRRATILPGNRSLVVAAGDPVRTADPGAFLLDPNPAVTRAGLVEDLARTIDAWKIDDQIAFLSTDRLVYTPFARTLRVLDSLPWHEKRVAARLRELEVGAVDIRRRGLAGDVEQIRRRLRLAGPRRATLAITRRAGRPWCLICEDVPAAGQPPSPGATIPVS